HHTVDHAGFARAVIINLNASARFDLVLVDPSATFAHVTNPVVEHEAKSILSALSADHDYFAWLICGGECAGSSFRRCCWWLIRGLLPCIRRARLRKRQRRDQHADESVDCFLHHEFPRFEVDFWPQSLMAFGI